MIIELTRERNAYEKIKDAFTSVQQKGYGVVMPELSDITMEDPVLIAHGSKYGVKMKAISPSIHMIRANIETEIAPIVGSREQAESKKEGENLNRLTNRAVYLLCWMRRYLPKLFINWKPSDIGCFIYMGGCRNESEALFMSFLGRLPLDVLILCPDLNIKCCLEDKLLYEINYSESLPVMRYPEQNSQVKIGTAAYHAERELDTLMYQDSGLYRNQQYVRANVINLQTMYEEIKILWDQELKYRPNFSTVDGVVNIPVIFSKISGVKDGNISQYWESIAALVTEDTVVVKRVPYIEPTASNPMKAFSRNLTQTALMIFTDTV